MFQKFLVWCTTFRTKVLSFVLFRKCWTELKQLVAFKVPNKRGWTHAVQDWFVEYRRAGVAPYLMGHLELGVIICLLLSLLVHFFS